MRAVQELEPERCPEVSIVCRSYLLLRVCDVFMT